MTHRLARVVVLSGPSGSGKTRLARRLHAAHGWPMVPLDNFYKDGDDPDLPMSTLGIADWDDVRSWKLTEAVDTLERLCRSGHADLPSYDLSRSARIGTVRVELGSATTVVAEGIFASAVIEPLRERDLLACAICVRHNRWVNFVRRLTRDLREHRKPPVLLLRRGLRLAHAEPSLVAAQRAHGATPLTPRQASRLVARVTA